MKYLAAVLSSVAIVSAAYAQMSNVTTLTVDNPSDAGGRLRICNSAKTGATTIDWSIWNMTNGYGNGLSFWRYNADGTNAGPSVWFGDNGNVGIGTTGANSKLHVYNGGTMRPSNSTTNPTQTGIVLQGAANTALCFGASESPNDQYAGWIQMRHTLEANDTFPLSLQPNGGNVGIGTTNPSDKLHVVGRIQIDSATTDGFIQTKGDNSHIRFGRSNGVIGNLVGYRPDVSSGDFVFYSYSGNWVFCGGNVGIGTTNPTQKLSVNGTILAKEVIVQTNWSDYVFSKDYKLASLAEVEQHIQTHGHLPGVPSAQEVAEKGVSVGDIQAVLLAKIEELTLHVIAQEKQLREQAAHIKTLEARSAPMADR